MATQRTINGPTPNGGVKSVAYYQDAEGNPVEQVDAKRVEIHELGEHDEILFRTYATI